MITFQNINFPIREILLPKVGNIVIATQSLNEMLFNVNNQYVSFEAEQIDNQIFYFVENEQIELEDKILIKIVNKEIL